MNITDEQSGKTEVTDPVVRGNFLPENPTQFDYLHAIRAIASRIGNKQIFDLADAGMNLVDAEATCSAYEQAFECWCFLGGRGTLVPESRTQFEEGLPIQVEPQDLIAFFEHNA